MTSAISREDADKISGDFEKIASRDERSKSVKSNIKVVIAIVTILVIVMAVLLYFYLKNPNNLITTRLGARANLHVENGFNLEAGNQLPQQSFGGQPINVSSAQLPALADFSDQL